MVMQSHFIQDEQERMQNILEKKAVDKEHVEFEEDYLSLTCLSYLKENHDNLALTTLKES